MTARPITRGLGRGIAAVSLALMLLATACTGGDDETGAPSETAATSPQPGARSLPAVGLKSVFEKAGITIVDDPASAPQMTGLQLWEWQVENMERELEAGQVFVGADLDGVAGPVGGMPFSYLLAGWMESAVTQNAVEAARFMGDQPLDEAPSLGYPSAVLVLFVADAVQVALEDQPTAMPTAMLASVAQSGICSTLASWVNRALDFVFNALKVDVEGSGFFSWLGTVWNAAVDLARDAVVGVIERLTAPVVSLIKNALAVVAVVSMAGSLLSRWWIDVEPSTRSFLLPSGGEPPREETFTARVDTKVDFEWDDYIVDCADVADLDLPDPSTAEGSPVTWDVTGFPRFGTLERSDDEIDGDNEATLDWKSAVEESGEGETRTGWVWAHATVVNDRFENIKTLVSGWINGKVSGIPFEDEVKKGIAVLIEPVFERLVELVQFRGQGPVVVVYHVPEDPEDASVTILDPTTSCEPESNDEIIIDPQTVGAVLGDGVSDSLPYLVRVEGVTEDVADDVVLKVYAEPRARLQAHIDLGVDRIIDSAIAPVPVSTGRLLDDGSWILGGLVPLGEDGESLTEYVMWAWIDLPGGGQEEDFLVPLSYGERDDDDFPPSCEEGEDDLLTSSGFMLLEQRFNLLTIVAEDSPWIERRRSAVSYEVDRTRQSVEIDDGTEVPIDPLGFDGYRPLPLVDSEGSAYSLVGLVWETTTPTPSEIVLSGEFVRTLRGRSVSEGDPDNLSGAAASVGVLFSFTDGPLDVHIVWDCGLGVTLEALSDLEVDEVLYDNRFNEDGSANQERFTRKCEQIVPSFEGTLQPDTVYQLVVSLGLFNDRYANEGTVWGNSARVLNETGVYDVNETNIFALILTAAD